MTLIGEIEPITLLPPPALAAVTDINGYIVREHFEEFRGLYRPELTKDIAAMAFYRTVDPRPQRMIGMQFLHRRGPVVTSGMQPPDGVVIKPRSEVGILPPHDWHNNPWNTHKSKFAIAVASLIDYSYTLPTPKGPQAAKVNEFIMQLASTLETQVTLQETALGTQQGTTPVMSIAKAV